MTTLLLAEARRALHRRVVWVLVGVALLGIVAGGLGVFVDSADLDVAQTHADGFTHAAIVSDWWVSGGGDGILPVAAIFLAVGGLLGGATVVGGEWKAGTVATVLTWEPRRLRLHLARLGACALVAFVIALVLQALFLAAFLPAAFAHGSTAGVDGPWVASVAAAMIRIGLVTALAAVLGAAVATLGRSTAAALAVAGGWLAVGEPILRAWKPGLGRSLVAENVAVLVTWAPLDGEPSNRPVTALVVLLLYAAVLSAGAGLWFRQRDVAVA